MKAKTIFRFLYAVFACAVLVFSCASLDSAGQPAVDNSFNLVEAAVEKTFTKLKESPRLTAGLRVALLPPDAADKSLADQVFDALYERFINSSGLDMVDRRDMDMAFAEQDLGMSGRIDDDTAARIGHMLGAQVVVFGELADLDSAQQRLVYRALEVETGRMLAISTERF